MRGRTGGGLRRECSWRWIPAADAGMVEEGERAEGRGGGRTGGSGRPPIRRRAEDGGRTGMCSARWGDVFSFWANVFSFRANAFTFRPNVFTLAGEVFSEEVERGERRGVRVGRGSALNNRGACVDGVAGCAESDHGAGSRLKTPGWRREGMCPLCQANVSSFRLNVSTFAGNVSSFWANVSSFRPDVSPLPAEVSSPRGHERPEARADPRLSGRSRCQARIPDARRIGDGG